MTTLFLDIGNTRIKWRGGDDPVGRGAVAHRRQWHEAIGRITESFPNGLIGGVCVASVAGSADAEIAASLREALNISPEFARSSASLAGVSSRAADPTLLGVDRWLALAAAYEDCGRAICVADLGTTITIDVADQDGVRQGGLILPGLHLMADSLVTGTAGVRFDDAELPGQLELGSTTESSVKNATLYAAVAFIERVHEDVSARLGTPVSLYVTGGDGPIASRRLRAQHSHEPELVLNGLRLAFASIAGRARLLPSRRIERGP